MCRLVTLTQRFVQCSELPHVMVRTRAWGGAVMGNAPCWAEVLGPPGSEPAPTSWGRGLAGCSRGLGRLTRTVVIGLGSGSTVRLGTASAGGSAAGGVGLA